MTLNRTDLADLKAAKDLLEKKERAGVLLLARRFKDLPGKRVGLLLPASVACNTSLLALQFAGKVPVLLNWTTGPAGLAHAAKAAGLTHVITSRAFVDRTGVKVEGTEYVYLEDVRKSIGRWEQRRAMLTVVLRPGHIRNQVPGVAADEPAVILFTSGSEKAPKAVPLTHGNLLANQRAVLSALGLTRDDCMLGFLPAFHSFGLTVTGLLPMLAGLRVVYHPDPTAAAALVHKVEAYKPTLMGATPTFLTAILGRARPEQLRSLRLLCVGAEKCPPALAETFGRFVPGASLLEGYGITECSPVVAVNLPGACRLAASAGPCRASKCASSIRIPKRSCRPGAWASCGSAVRPCSPATSLPTGRRPSASGRGSAGTPPATWPTWTPRASFGFAAARSGSSRRGAR